MAQTGWWLGPNTFLTPISDSKNEELFPGIDRRKRMDDARDSSGGRYINSP
jgi:hypothetical protein